MRPIIAVYDACVLYPAPLRSLLMYLAVGGWVQPRWTDEIHEEWMRSVARDYPDIPRPRIERVRDLIDAAVPAGRVTGYERLTDTLSLPDTGDRHVLAAAIHARARVIVTFNLKDFPADTLAAHRIEAHHPDGFLVSLDDASPGALIAAFQRQRMSLRNPPMTADQLLATLQRQGLVQAVSRLRQSPELL